MLSTLDQVFAEVVHDNSNIVADISNLVVPNKGKCVAVKLDYVIELKEANELEIIGKRVSSLDEAFEIHNKYAFRKSFSVRCDKLRRRKGS